MGAGGRDRHAVEIRGAWCTGGRDLRGDDADARVAGPLFPPVKSGRQAFAKTGTREILARLRGSVTRCDDPTEPLDATCEAQG